jgi:hypothetical protein
MSVVGATATATENMVMIKARSGEVHRPAGGLGVYTTRPSGNFSDMEDDHFS